MGTSDDFQAAGTTRDKAAAEYFSSEAFLIEARKAIQASIIEGGKKHAHITGMYMPKKQDMPSIEGACKTLKAEFPELNHLRITHTLSTEIIADTKKNTLAHRTAVALNHLTLGGY